jgi:hypothetical protein
MLGPDAGVDDADDDILAGLALTAELAPDAAARVETEERRRVVGRRLRQRVAPDRDDVLRGLELGDLTLAEGRGKAVERVLVVVDPGSADRLGDRVMARPQVPGVLLDVRIALVQLLTRCGLRGREAADPPAVGADRRLVEQHDVDVADALADARRVGIAVLARACGGGQEHGGQARDNDRGPKSESFHSLPLIAVRPTVSRGYPASGLPQSDRPGNSPENQWCEVAKRKTPLTPASKVAPLRGDWEDWIRTLRRVNIAVRCACVSRTPVHVARLPRAVGLPVSLFDPRRSIP